MKSPQVCARMKQEDIANLTMAEATRLSAMIDKNVNQPMDLLSQWFALQYIEKIHSEYKQGNKLALMKAIRTSAYHGLIMPEWIAKDFILAIDKLMSYEFKSWDDVLGSPFPKNTNLIALKKKETLKFKVFNEAINIINNNPDQPIDAGLYENIGKKFYIGKTQASEHCREVEEIIGGSLKQYKDIIRDLSHGKRPPPFIATIN